MATVPVLLRLAAASSSVRGSSLNAALLLLPSAEMVGAPGPAWRFNRRFVELIVVCTGQKSALKRSISRCAAGGIKESAAGAGAIGFAGRCFFQGVSASELPVDGLDTLELAIAGEQGRIPAASGFASAGHFTHRPSAVRRCAAGAPFHPAAPARSEPRPRRDDVAFAATGRGLSQAADGALGAAGKDFSLEAAAAGSVPRLRPRCSCPIGFLGWRNDRPAAARGAYQKYSAVAHPG